MALNYSIIPKNAVLPIIEDFLFELKGDNLTITTTNLEVTMITNLTVQNSGKKDGSVAIPGKILLETVKNLVDTPITMVVKDFQITMVTLSGNYKIPGDHPSDFPTPSYDDLNLHAVSNGNAVHNALKKALVAVSTDELRRALCGVLFEISSDNICVVGTDAHRLVETVIPCEAEIDNTYRLIVPQKGCIAMRSISFNNEANITISFNESNIKFFDGEIMVICKLVDAKYPDYKTIIRGGSPVISNIDKLDIINSLKRVNIYSNKSTNKVTLSFDENTVHVHGNDIDMSNEATEQLRCSTSGLDAPNIKISLNNKYLREVIGVLDTDEVHMGLKSATESCIIIDENENERTTVLLMPIMGDY